MCICETPCLYICVCVCMRDRVCEQAVVSFVASCVEDWSGHREPAVHWEGPPVSTEALNRAEGCN